MSAEVVNFPHAVQPVRPIAHYVRIGESGYRHIGNLQASGRLSAKRSVVDASKLQYQQELVGSLRAAGSEIVLDTKAAELAAVNRFSGYAKGAPWSSFAEGKPLGAEFFHPLHGEDIIAAIARFAVENGVHAVLAPGHFIGDPSFGDWFDVDRRSCIALRRALDREGGQHIAIDYMLIAPHTSLNDDEQRRHLVDGLVDLPFENLWIRASGFGSDAAPLSVRRYINAFSYLHNLGKPIVADYLGGLVGMTALAFGAVSGISHGIGERERFSARDWHKEPKKQSGHHGRQARVFVASLNRSMTIPELEVLASARGGKRLVGCDDRQCCPHSLQDMLNDPRQHAAYQANQQIQRLAAVPDLSREQHFLNGPIQAADRHARQAKRLRPSQEVADRHSIDVEGLMKRIAEHSKRMDKMRSTLEHLHEERGQGGVRARPVERDAVSCERRRASNT